MGRKICSTKKKINSEILKYDLYQEDDGGYVLHIKGDKYYLKLKGKEAVIGIMSDISPRDRDARQKEASGINWKKSQELLKAFMECEEFNEGKQLALF